MPFVLPEAEAQPRFRPEDLSAYIYHGEFGDYEDIRLDIENEYNVIDGNGLLKHL